MPPIHAPRSAPLIAGPACLVLTYAGAPLQAQLGHRFEVLADHLIIGRGADADLQVDLDAVSRRHARLQRQEGAWQAVDLQSTNGTYVNDHPVGAEGHPLHDGDELRIGVALFRFLCGADLVSAYLEELRRLSVTDGLTRVANRRHFVEALTREAARAARHRRPLSVIRIEIEQFKALTDKYGTLMGDCVLREVARRAGSLLRPDDLLARSDEAGFVVLLPEIGAEDAQRLAFQVGAAVSRQTIDFADDKVAVAVAVGASTLKDGEDGEALLRLADERAGSNQ